ncbi:PhnD/SsuA/transferrin family substrate-binding protein [Leptolyngbya sp. FACHB-711]|jgi:phosphonate transport system substrate-binding protein|uniref:phosphate/phosphite/phosphonate ABC transporter substrate-binding protein n=1 Tax=unclassified Leptolyngbya TaxID=2650499 RepID=UPI0016851957|nr:PhnD/SsuA/transferrin family substrate-binding protein [Leptolyngbya sp. FACHB-711]MBD1851992.1 phosphate/phosphite/phosphonate ABC transporter substrate-binding protein [Cyanobacteria bacterium FACHB-502]MBD2026278.1 phosphate/phosphite/phosphonate ABC transporter substrate-binding protein [Leptolyngbya sp. FACHB-711]
MRSRLVRLVLCFLLGLIVASCSGNQSVLSEEITIGMVSYGEIATSTAKYERFQEYLAERTKAVIQLEPAYNELQAIDQVTGQRWDVVFAPPGLAAIAIREQQYKPLFPLEGLSNTQRSFLIVRADSPMQAIADISQKTVALGQPGSAAGYYLPLYDLYGLTLAGVKFAPTPKDALTWLNDQSVDVVALSEKDFEQYHREFPTTPFRVLHKSRWIPPGVVLINPSLDPALQQQIQQAMLEAPSDIVSDAGYLSIGKLPNYDQFIQLVAKIRPLEDDIKQTPITLINRL